jgi:hypothetical protein
MRLYPRQRENGHQVSGAAVASINALDKQVAASGLTGPFTLLGANERSLTFRILV